MRDSWFTNCAIRIASQFGQFLADSKNIKHIYSFTNVVEPAKSFFGTFKTPSSFVHHSRQTCSGKPIVAFTLAKNDDNFCPEIRARTPHFPRKSWNYPHCEVRGENEPGCAGHRHCISTSCKKRALVVSFWNFRHLGQNHLTPLWAFTVFPVARTFPGSMQGRISPRFFISWVGRENV